MIRVNRSGIILLAAGRSSRLGSPKQLLTYKGKSLLRHAVDAALGSEMTPLIVVLGAHSELLKKELESEKGVQVIINKGWEEGMASSIRCGVNAAMQTSPSTDGLIIMVCDQPFVSPALLKRLVDTQHQTGLPVVASGYHSSLGVPALFYKTFFETLLELEGDTGARKLLKEHKDVVAMVDFPEGVIDIDTENDYHELQDKKKREPK